MSSNFSETLPRPEVDIADIPPEERGQLYDAEYYRTGCGETYERNNRWTWFFGGIADQIVRSLKPRTVFDAGCAMGMLVEALWDRGVEARGIDISEYAISQVRPDMRPYCTLGSITDPIEGRHDLISCIEVLEHVPYAEALVALDQLTQATDTILFSSTPTDFKEPTHCNVQPTIAWLRLFALRGFWPDLIYDASYVSPHAFLARRGEEFPDDVLVLFSEKKRLQAALVEREQRIAYLDRLSADRGAGWETSAEQNREMAAKISVLEQEMSEGQTSVRVYDKAVSEMRWSLEQREYALAEARREADYNRERVEQISQELTARQADMAHLELQVSRLAADMKLRLDAAAAEQDRQLRSQGAEMTKRHRAEVAGLESARSQAEQQLGAERVRAQDWVQREFARAQEWVKTERTEDAQRLAADRTQLQLQLASMTSRYEQVRQQAEDSQSELQSENAHLRGELSSIYSSPGWRLIAGYRKWLRNRLDRSKFARKVVEPTASWALKRLTRNRPFPAAPPAAVTSALPAEPGGTPPASHENAVAGAPLESRSAGALQASAIGEAPASNITERDQYIQWYTLTEPSPDRLQLQRAMSCVLADQPLVSIVLPVYKVPLTVLQAAVSSVLEQTYEQWELCVAHGDPADAAARKYLEEAAAGDPRIKVKLLAENLGISGNSNEALAMVTGEFIALLDHDDTLAPFALYEVVSALNESPEIDFLYSDKDQIDESGSRRMNPLFKPEWSPDIMLSANYPTHLTVMRSSIVHDIGGWRYETDGAQDWDIFLRVVRQSRKIRHIPKVLYHWRQIATSVASGGLQAKPYAAAGQLRALEDHLGESGSQARVEFTHESVPRIEWGLPDTRKVSIVLVTSQPARQAIAHAKELLGKTTHTEVEVLIPASSVEPAGDRIRIVRVPDEQPAHTRIAAAAKAAFGDVLILLDDGVSPAASDWVDELAGPLEDENIVAVGAKLIDPGTHKLRHAGIVFDNSGRSDYAFAGEPEHVCNVYGAANWYRNWSAVSGACLALRTEVWRKLGRFDEPGALRPDLDLCLTLRKQGRRILYNPYARMYQTRAAAIEEWPASGSSEEMGTARELLGGTDPYCNPNLKVAQGRFEFRLPQRRDGVIHRHDYAAESRILVDAFDFTAAQIAASRNQSSRPGTRSVDRITWVLPEFTNAFYGGVHTILRFADHFATEHGVESRFALLGGKDPAEISKRIGAAFPRLGSAACTILRDYRETEDLPECDAAVASLWTTAYSLLHHSRARRKFYFVQDYEPLFYPAGSTSGMVEATYRFGFLGICNTVTLRDIYQEHGGEGEFFDPSIDPGIFHANGRTPDPEAPLRLFCYGRPGHPRNCFELLAGALRLLKERLDDRVQILAAGADWDPEGYGLGGVVDNLGLLGYRNTGALYRTCDAGVAMMTTYHPSYLPLELMACGALVVTNRNPRTSWLLEDRKNCLLADASPSSLAEALEEGLTNQTLRRQITGAASVMMAERYSNWKGQAEKIFEYIRTNS